MYVQCLLLWATLNDVNVRKYVCTVSVTLGQFE